MKTAKTAKAVIRGGVVLVLLAGAMVQAAPADETRQLEQLRARIQAERTRIDEMFSADTAACQQQFAVTACVEQARQRRRDALAGARSQALLLDDIERRERAVARREAITVKQREAASRAAPLLPASASEFASASASASASTSIARMRPSPSAASAAIRRSHSAAASEAAAEALRRAQATRERQAEIEATQDRIRARQIERLREGKVAAPLPVPAASR